MSIAKMEKLAVIGLSNNKDKLISDLADLGIVEITERFNQNTDEFSEADVPQTSELNPVNQKEQKEMFDEVDGDPDYVSTIDRKSVV